MREVSDSFRGEHVRQSGLGNLYDYSDCSPWEQGLPDDVGFSFIHVFLKAVENINPIFCIISV